MNDVAAEETHHTEEAADSAPQAGSERKDTRSHPGEFVTFRLMRTVEGLSLFFVFFMLLVFLLYIIGSTQQFLDSSQSMLLQLLEISSLLCSFSSAYYLFLLSTWMIRRRFLVLPRIIYSVVAMALGVMFAFGSSFLTILFTSTG